MVAAVTLLGTFIASRAITNVALLYLLPVLLAASCFGLWTGIITALTSLLAYNFFFIPPLHTLTIADPQNIITAWSCSRSPAVSHMAGRLRDTAQFSRASAARSQTLAGFARRLTGRARRAGSLRPVRGKRQPARHPHRAADAQSRRPAQSRGLHILAASPPEITLPPLDLSSRNGRSTTAAPPGAARTRWARPNGCSCRSRRGRALAVFGWPTRMPGNRCAQTCCPCSPASRPDRTGARPRPAGGRTGADETSGGARRLARGAALVGQPRLRTPLTAVIGLLGDLVPASAEQDKVLTMARAEAERLQRFVANLLDMVRIETGAVELHIEPVDLAEAVTSAIHDLRRLLGSRPLHIAIAPDLPLVRLDARLLHHCLINLIQNAAQYSPPDRPITLVARRLPQDSTCACSTKAKACLREPKPWCSSASPVSKGLTGRAARAWGWRSSRGLRKPWACAYQPPIAMTARAPASPCTWQKHNSGRIGHDVRENPGGGR
jgi:two-component system sensor histidine kinase KdpD